MSMTITEKILAAHAQKEKVSPGELINVRIDLALGNDITAPLAIQEFEKIGMPGVFDPDRVVLVPDHFVPNKDIKSAEQAKILREFSSRQKLTNYYEAGRMGIEHCLLPEEGLVGPGDVVIGADSHTCTYGALGAFSTGVGSTDLAAAMASGEIWLKVPESIKLIYNGELPPWVSGKDLILLAIGDLGVDGAAYQALEFTGPVIDRLSMDSRFTAANMAIEAGAKNGIFPPDEITKQYIEGRAKRPYTFYSSSPDASYKGIREYDVSGMEPLVAFPHLPEKVHPVSRAGHIKIDQVVIGSCTNGRLEDLRLAAGLIKGKKSAPGSKTELSFPARRRFYLQYAEGRPELRISSKSGAVFSTPTCGPCLGGHMGILAKGERCLAYYKPQLCWQDGRSRERSLLVQPRGCGRFRDSRIYRWARGG